MSEPTRKEMRDWLAERIERFNEVTQYAKLYPYEEAMLVMYQAIYHLIEHGPEVTEQQISAWADRIMSEVEITGNVPNWLIRDILEYAGVRVKQ